MVGNRVPAIVLRMHNFSETFARISCVTDKTCQYECVLMVFTVRSNGVNDKTSVSICEMYEYLQLHH